MFTVYFVSIISGVLYGITEGINKNIVEEKFSSLSYAFWQSFLNLLLFTFPFFYFGHLPKETGAYVFVFLSAFLCLLGNNLIILSYKKEDISHVNILSRSSLIISFLSGVILLNEKVSLVNCIGFLLILLGIFAIFYKHKALKVSRGFLYGLLSGVFYGMIPYFDKRALAFFDPISLLFVFYVFLCFLLLLIPKTKKDLKAIIVKYKTKILVSRLTAVSAFYLLAVSIKYGNITIVNSNMETAFLLSGVFIGIFFLRERGNLASKICGALTCSLGIILLNLS